MNFVTISSQRSGSSFFQRCLDSHPSLEARQELLRSEDTRNSEVLQEIYKGKQNFGFKVQYNQLNNDCWVWLRNNVTVIQLIRRDILETALWWPAHFKEGEEGLAGGNGPPLVVKADTVTADIEKVLKRVDELNHHLDFYSPRSDYQVFYEDDLTCDGGNAQEFCNTASRRKLLSFLGVKDYAIRDREKEQRKNPRKPTKDLVSNYDEMMEALKDRRLWYA